MKYSRIIALAIALIMTAAFPASASFSETISIPELNITRKPVPETEGMRFVESMKLGWNLGNTFDAYTDNPWFTDELDYESCWCGVKTSEAMLKAIKDAGFGFIRIPVSWHDHVSGENFEISESWLARVKEVAACAIDKGLNVVINIHHDTRPGCFYPSMEQQDVSISYITSIWTQLSAVFADFDNRLIFESINEPRLVGTKFEWNLMNGSADCADAVECLNAANQSFVDTVRASGGGNAERFLMIPGYCASLQGATFTGFRMPEDTAEDRLILSVHAYTPYDFALQPPTESGSTDSFSIADKVGTGDIDYLVDTLYGSFVAKGIPVLIGEFGSRDKGGNLQARVEHAAYYIAQARANGITCCWWDNNCFSGDGERFGLFDRASLEWASPEILDAMLMHAQ